MYSLLFIFTIFVGCFDCRFSLLGYWDELVVAMVIVLWLTKFCNTGKLSRERLSLAGIIMIFIVIALMGNVIRPELQSKKIAIIKDIVAVLKFPVLMILLPEIYNGKKQSEIVHKAANISKIIVIVTTIVAIIGYFVDIGVYTDEVRLIKCFQLYFNHPTFFVSSYVLVLIMLMADSLRKNRLYILLNCCLIFLAQRTKGYIAILLALAILIIGQNNLKQLLVTVKSRMKIKREYVIALTILIIGAGWIVGRNKISLYMGYGVTAARPALYLTGLLIAADMFPLGAGLGTFASSLSGEYYSKVYYLYGISTVNGMTPEKYNYIGDTFWPYIYGQSGFVGLVCYAAFIVKCIQYQFVKFKDFNKIAAFGTLWCYALFASTAEAFFTNTSGVQMAIVLCIFLANNFETESINNTSVYKNI